jgi:opacity protein-like surface antigen
VNTHSPLLWTDKLDKNCRFALWLVYRKRSKEFVSVELTALRRYLVKGKFLLSVVALLLSASFSGRDAAAQVAKPAAADVTAFDRYEVYGAFAYSGANQVKSSSALLGFNIGAQAKLKKWFGANVDFGDYLASATSNGLVKPTMTTFLAGPEVYIPADNLTGFFHVLFGGAHTGNAGEKPDISFAYAVGGGFEYAFSKHLSGRMSGDGIVSSFVQDPTDQGLSPHSRVNPRATIGIGYRF